MFYLSLASFQVLTGFRHSPPEKDGDSQEKSGNKKDSTNLVFIRPTASLTDECDTIQSLEQTSYKKSRKNVHRLRIF